MYLTVHQSKAICPMFSTVQVKYCPQQSTQGDVKYYEL